MSTFYTLIKEKDSKYDGEFSIDESSNTLSLVFCDDGRRPDKSYYTSKELTPEEMAKVLLKGLTVCSYWMDSEKLKKIIRNHLEYEIY